MNFTVINRDIQVGDIQMVGVANASLFIIGDADSITLASAFDTPPESLIVRPFFVPLTSATKLTTR